MNENTAINSQPWYPEPHPHFGPWIEHTNTIMPVSHGSHVQWLTYKEQYDKVWVAAVRKAEYVEWDNPDMVAYRVKLSTNQA